MSNYQPPQQIQARMLGDDGGLTNNDIAAAAAITPDKLSGPVFAAYRSANATNVTGNAAAYTCVFDTAHISNANYATGTGIFTAPATGRYLFCGDVAVVAGGAAETSMVLQLITTGRTNRQDSNPYGSRNLASGIYSAAFGWVVQMTAGDTAKIVITISGGASNDATFVGANGFSNFCGNRVG